MKNKRKKEKERVDLSPTEHRRSQSLDGSDSDPTSMRSKNYIVTRYKVKLSYGIQLNKI